MSLRDDAAGELSCASCAPLASVPRAHRRPIHAVTSPAQAQGFDLATATKWTSELLGDFCDTADFSLGFVPDAALLIPPEQNFFVADAPEHAPPSNKDVLLGDTERDSEGQAEAWGCSGPDGAELCANLENLFKLD